MFIYLSLIKSCPSGTTLEFSPYTAIAFLLIAYSVRPLIFSSAEWHRQSAAECNNVADDLNNGHEGNGQFGQGWGRRAMGPRVAMVSRTYTVSAISIGTTKALPLGYTTPRRQATVQDGVQLQLETLRPTMTDFTISFPLFTSASKGFVILYKSSKNSELEFGLLKLFNLI